MAAIPQLYPQLSLHLADRSLTPLISSSKTPAAAADPKEQQRKQDALAGLASTALTIHDAALHFGLGRPQRVLVDYGGSSASSTSPSSSGPVMIQTFLDPAVVIREQCVLPTTPAQNNPQAMMAAAAAAGHLTIPSRRPLSQRGLSALSIRSAHSRPPTSSHTTSQRSLLGDGERLGANGSSPRVLADRGSYSGNHSFSPKPALLAVHNGHVANDDDEHNDHDDDNDDDDDEDDHKDDGNEPADSPPMLVGIVLSASAEQAAEAGRAIARLEKIGREIQRRWSTD